METVNCRRIHQMTCCSTRQDLAPFTTAHPNANFQLMKPAELDLQELEKQLQSIVNKISFSKVSVDQPLISTQVLDSIGVVDFVVEVEQRFGVAMDLQDFHEANLNTVTQIARKLHQSP